ncbi:MAG: ABC transporter permease [Flavobacteriales bacterium]|nr:ABC transporter permease [Flavobacteriales bacterium]MCB9181977.1 ABC transporter permease [Flavobacteriales bacterium]MCB9200451.1 ABC transporter permease [Flavobacteriales bacterium]
MGKIGLIIWREYITRVRKPSFLIMTFLGPLLIAGAVTLMVYFSLKESSEQLVLVVDKPQLLTDKLKDGKDIHFFYTQQEQSDSAFKAGPYTLMVDVNEEVLTTNTVQFFYKELPGIITQRYVQAEIEKVLEKEKLRVNEVDPEVYASIKTSLKLQLFDIDKLGEESKDQELAIVGFFLGYIMFFFVFLYAVQVMRGVMEEKTNRIVEVLISSVKPFQLMMGKIVGIALVGFTQFLLWIVLTGVLATIGSTVMVAGKYSGEDLAGQQMTVQMQEELGVDADEMPKIDESAVLGILDQINIPLVLALFGFYFLGGYLLYSSLFAAVGSAVDSEAETQQFMMPVTIPIIIAIFIAQTAMQNPSSPVVFWGSIIPFTSPVVMMVRVAMGTAFEQPWELALSMGLLILGFLGTTWLAARIYRTGILMYGKKVSWKELGKWLFYKG